MTKQAIIAVVVGVLILIGATGTFLYSQSKPKEEITKVAQSQPSPTPNNAMANSITELLNRGEKSKCTFSTSGEKSNTTGTVYTSGENARADISTTVNNKEDVAHMIRTGNTFYMWGDSVPMGIKMVMDVNELASKMQEDNTFNTFDPNKEMDFKCVTWTEDAKFFTPPTTIKFASFGNTAPTGLNTNTSVKPTSGSNSESNTNQCNICNSLTGAAKTACLAQFNCQ